MARCRLLFSGCALALAMTGCASIHPRAESGSVHETSQSESPAHQKDKNGNEDKKNKDDKEEEKCPEDKKAKTIFEWAIGKDKKKANGNGDANGNEEEEDRIVTDRPDFTEASSTVGKGRIQLEAGYTYTRDRDNGASLNGHSFPEALLRIGLFADWFELRIGQNFDSDRNSFAQTSATFTGAEDLYLGVKLGLTEQKKCLPETGIILALTTPTGAKFLSSREVDPQVDFLFGWDIIKDCLDLGGGLLFSRTRETIADEFPFSGPTLGAGSAASAHPFLQIAPSLTVGYTLTHKLHAYTEGYALLPHSSTDPDVGPEYYLDGGFTYLVTDNFQLDIRAGVGLNRHADDFFAGSGFSVRY